MATWATSARWSAPSPAPTAPFTIDLPGPLFGVAQAVTSVVGRVVPLPEEFSAEALRDARASYLATSAKARRELGWTFRPLHQGLRETAEADGWIS